MTWFVFFISTTLCADVIQTEHVEIKVETVATGLSHPWGMAFLPNGDLLVTQRTGQLRKIANGKLLDQVIQGLPVIQQHGQGGLFDIALHPKFAENRLVFLAYAGKSSVDGYGTEVLRAKLIENELKEVAVIFRAEPKSRGGRHFGGRLLFSSDNTLFVTLGDRGDRPRAQDLTDHAGSLIRINENGSVPTDNPFVHKSNVRADIYSYGHRNIQGIAKHPLTGMTWTHEHGPQGGDEINIIQAGVNYGWPVITYGKNYGLGTKIGEGTHKKGMRQPLYQWTPSIAPSGMAFYTGENISQWQNNLFVGSLKFGLLVRLEIENDQVVHQERMLNKTYGRIRDVRQGPDGLLYLLTDDKNGSVLRIRKN